MEIANEPSSLCCSEFFCLRTPQLSVGVEREQQDQPECCGA
jgi:hypothetical protein